MRVTIHTDNYPHVAHEDLIAACGLIPYFFEDAAMLDWDTLQEVADEMDSLYQFGGFRFPMEGKVDAKGRYTYPEDPDLDPYVTVVCGRYTCHIYPYAIVAIQDDKGNTKIGRFD